MKNAVFFGATVGGLVFVIWAFAGGPFFGLLALFAYVSVILIMNNSGWLE